MSDERDLRERFARLREEEATGRPGGAQLIARAKARRGMEARDSGRPWRTLAPVAAVAVLCLLLLVQALLPEPAGPERPLARNIASVGDPATGWSDIDLETIGSLRAPTDALLGIGHLSLLGDRTPEFMPLPALLPKPPPHRESALGGRTVS